MKTEDIAHHKFDVGDIVTNDYTHCLILAHDYFTDIYDILIFDNHYAGIHKKVWLSSQWHLA